MVKSKTLIEEFRELLYSAIDFQQVKSLLHLDGARSGRSRAQEAIDTLVVEDYKHGDLVMESLRETLRLNNQKVHDLEDMLANSSHLRNTVLISAVNRDMLVLEFSKPNLRVLEIALTNIERVTASTIDTPLDLGHNRQVIVVQLSSLKAI